MTAILGHRLSGRPNAVNIDGCWKAAISASPPRGDPGRQHPGGHSRRRPVAPSLKIMPVSFELTRNFRKFFESFTANANHLSSEAARK
jgi:hypothetical protein